MLHTQAFPRGVKWSPPWHPLVPCALGAISSTQAACQQALLVIQAWAKLHIIERAHALIYVWDTLILHYSHTLIAKHCMSTCVAGWNSFTAQSKGEASGFLGWYLVLEQCKIFCQSQRAGMTVNWCHFCSGFQALSVIRYILCRIHLILQTCHLCYIKYSPGEKTESLSILASLEIKCLS